MSKYVDWPVEQLLAEQQRLTQVRKDARAEGVAVQRELDHRAIEAAASKVAGKSVKIARDAIAN